MAGKKTTRKKSSTRNKSADSNTIGRLIDQNVKLLAMSSEVALKAYVGIVKTFTDQRIAQASARLVEQVAEGWKDALTESTKLLRNAYGSLDRR